MNRVDSIGAMKNMALETDFAKELEYNLKRCLESEEKSNMYEIRCMMLEIEVEDLKKRNKELEEHITRTEEKGKATIVDLTGDENEIEELMIENNVLQCEKTKAESELSFWKEKFNILTSQVSELESKMNIKSTNESSIEINDEMFYSNKDNMVSTPKIDKLETRANREYRTKVKKRLPFEDVSYNIYEDDDIDLFTSAKRKKSSKIVTSDDDDDDDDNAPICTLINKNHEHEVKEDVNRKPLKRIKKLDDITFDLYKNGNSSSEDEKDEEDDESLNGFIVESSESESESEDEDGINEYKLTLDKIRRKKDLKLKWVLEGDMLADFGKDPELCMKAVCALYRQQTEDEKECKGTLHQNARGFSHTDAYRGCEVGEFLTDGDSNGDLNKTVEELEEYDAKGVDLCMKLATKYSKQLFEIYKNKEDPYFLP